MRRRRKRKPSGLLPTLGRAGDGGNRDGDITGCIKKDLEWKATSITILFPDRWTQRHLPAALASHAQAVLGVIAPRICP